MGSDHVVVGEEILLNKKVVAFFYRYFRRRERGDDNIEEGPPTRMSFLGRKLDSNDVSKKSLEQSSYFSPSNSNSAIPTYVLGLLEFVMIVRKIVLCNGIMLLQRHGKYIFSWPKLGQLRINNKA